MRVGRQERVVEEGFEVGDGVHGGIGSRKRGRDNERGREEHGWR
jgi:hypothetical protein